MKRVAIGKEYKNAFDNIYTLIKDYNINKYSEMESHGEDTIDDNQGIELKVEEENREKRIIQGDLNVFYYDANVSEHATTALENSFDASGAMWFNGVRGGEVNNSGIAEWVKFIEDFANYYHYEYSFIEYDATLTNNNGMTVEKGKGLINKIIEVLLPYVKNGYHIEDAGKNDTEDVYGVTLMLNVNPGVGESQPILGKVFFEKIGDEYHPIKESDAKILDSQIQKIVINEAENTRKDVDKQTKLSLINAFESLFNNSNLKTECDFSAALCISEGEEGTINDVKNINEMFNNKSDAEKVMNITEVSLLGMSHVKWANQSLIVKDRSKKPILKATLGSNGLSLFCTNCATDNVLVQNNQIKYIVQDENGNEIEAFQDIRDTDNLGIMDDTVLVKVKEVFSKHLKQPCPKGENCGLICESNLYNYGDNQNPIMRCKQCPYPDVIYDPKQTPSFNRATSKAQYTPNLVFASDEMALLLNDEKVTDTCAVCGRTFSKKYISGKVCSFCGTIPNRTVTTTKTATAKSNYKRYANLFNPLYRLITAGKNKYCFEDDEMLLFIIGNSKFLLNKTKVNENGYIDSPINVTKKFGGKK